ncbi:hypothetical protein [Acinetobacter bereziniae]|uniref:hypothetical protein n=1 Tax=Acinetobacter bereziniae TaxID=106648 RepID=UPI00073F53D3|nr:hypothetical protein [Acinetobacter bereziniae]RSZ25412.1 hypothetical protein NDM229_004815 [Acinetobacter bereziniae]
MENKEREAFEKLQNPKFFQRAVYLDNSNAYVVNDEYRDDLFSLEWVQEINYGWLMWQAAKATPEGFVLVPKDELTTTYYWEGAEHTVNCVSEYEMELEKGEIAELEKWEQTKSTKAFFANIYSDEDNFEIVEFDSIEAAELAIKENKAMIEAQEQKA